MVCYSSQSEADTVYYSVLLQMESFIVLMQSTEY